MWLVDEFEIEDSQAGPLKTENEKPAEEKVPAVIIWDFTKNDTLIARFTGEGPVLTLKEKNISMGTWTFEINPGQTICVPKWKILDIPDSNFNGFTKEFPSEQRMYMLRYEGRTETDIIIKVFKK